MAKWDPTERTAYRVNRAARLIGRVGEDRLRPLGLGVAYVPVMATLANEGPQPQRVLAERAGLEQPTMAQLLGRMERDGLIERRPNPADGRSSLVTLTAAAQAKVPAARRVLDQGNNELVDGLTPAEVRTLGELLDRVIANLESTIGEGDQPGPG